MTTRRTFLRGLGLTAVAAVVALPARATLAPVVPPPPPEPYILSVDTALGADSSAITIWSRRAWGGDYVLSAETVATIGQGDIAAGRDALENMTRVLNRRPPLVMVRPMSTATPLAERYPNAR